MKSAWRPEAMLVRGVLFLLACLPFALTRAHAEPEDPLFEEALRLSKRFDPETDLEAARTQFTRLGNQVRSDLDKAAGKGDDGVSPKTAIEILNRRLLKDRAVTYLSNRYWRDSLFTAALLANKGNCVSTSLLYYLVGRRLGLPLHLALAPEHVFVRWEDDNVAYNIETTDGGRIVSQTDVLRGHHLDAADVDVVGFARSLGDKEARAALLRMWAGTASLLGDEKGALALIDQAEKLRPGDPLTALARANQLRTLGRFEEARACLEPLLKETRSKFLTGTGGLLLSVIQENQGRLDEAIATARGALRQAAPPVVASLSEQLGVLYRQKRDFEQAIAYHKVAADIRADAHSYGQLGSVLTEAGRRKEAIAAYEKAVELNAEDPFPQVILAGLYELEGDKERGRKLFATIKRPRMDTLTWLGSLVWYYAVIKEEAKLLANMKAALEADASGAFYNYLLYEPDLDPYREKQAFVDLMKRYKPKR